MKTHRTTLIVLAISIIAVAILCFSAWQRSSLVRRLARANRDLSLCKVLAQQVKSLVELTPTRKADDSSLDESVSHIYQAMGKASIPTSAIIDIRIQGRNPIPKTDYIREDTSLTLHQITMSQVLKALEILEEGSGKSLVSAIEIRHRDSSDPDSEELATWDLQVTLTHLANAPRSKPRNP